MVSLVVALTCAFTNDVLANQSIDHPRADVPTLATRIASIVERVRSAEPALARDLPSDQKLVQFRNY